MDDDDLGTILQLRQTAGLRNEMAQIRQAEEARQQAEAQRAEQEYLGAHCPWCNSSLTGTPAVCADCTRAIFWVRLPLDEAVLELISRNLHSLKEVYRELLGASVALDPNQKLIHVPLSSQGEVAKMQQKLRPLDEKLTSYINYFNRVVERRESAVAKCRRCKTEVFERALAPLEEGTDRVCSPCSVRESSLEFVVFGFLTMVGRSCYVPFVIFVITRVMNIRDDATVMPFSSLGFILGFIGSFFY